MSLVLLIIPILSLGLYYSKTLSSAYEANMRRSGRATLKILEFDLRTKLLDYMERVTSISTNRQIITFLQADFKDAYDWNTAFKTNVNVFVNSQDNISKGISCMIYAPKIKSSYSRFIVSNPVEIPTGYDARIWPENARIHWDGTVMISGKACLASHITIKDFNMPYNTVAVLYSYIDTGALNSLFQLDENKSSILAVTDGNGSLVLSNQNQLSADMVKEHINNQTVWINGNNYLLLSDTVDLSGAGVPNWKIDYALPLKDLNNQIAQVWQTTLLLVLVILILSIIAASLFSKRIGMKVNNIVSSMKELEEGDTSARASVAAQDEFGRIASYFNHMAEQIDHYINEILLTKIELQKKDNETARIAQSKAEAQLLYLQSQINPHYLFNTLETIRMKTLINGDRETAIIIRLFANSFREILASESGMTTLQNELDLVRDFFIIQKFRYGDRLDYTINCEPSILGGKVPALLIQPIVENAVFHGIDASNRNGFVYVNVFPQEGQTVIVVSDNGMGMDEHELAGLQASILSGEGGGLLALRNIHSRLKLLYGSDFEFQINSAKDFGTSVYIRIPGGS